MTKAVVSSACFKVPFAGIKMEKVNLIHDRRRPTLENLPELRRRRYTPSASVTRRVIGTLTNFHVTKLRRPRIDNKRGDEGCGCRLALGRQNQPIDDEAKPQRT